MNLFYLLTWKLKQLLVIVIIKTIKGTLTINSKSSEEDHITQDNNSIQIHVRKNMELSLLCKGAKFTPTVKGNFLNSNSKSDILILTRRLRFYQILHKK